MPTLDHDFLAEREALQELHALSRKWEDRQKLLHEYWSKTPYKFNGVLNGERKVKQ